MARGGGGGREVMAYWADCFVFVFISLAGASSGSERK